MAKRKLVTKKSLRAGQTIYIAYIDFSTLDNSKVVRNMFVLPDTAPHPEPGIMATAAPVRYISDRLMFQGVGCKFFHSRRKAISVIGNMIDSDA